MIMVVHLPVPAAPAPRSPCGASKTNVTTINPVCHPNAGNHGLLLPINLNLHSPQPQQSILLHHQPTHIVLLARAPTVPLLDPHNLDDDSQRMGCLVHHVARSQWICPASKFFVCIFVREGTALKEYQYSNQWQSGDRWNRLSMVDSFSKSN
jgi:hypothetical protein